jgi:hypothetical protein
MSKNINRAGMRPKHCATEKEPVTENRYEASEDEEQISLIEWAELMGRTYPDLEWLHHIPNGGSRNKAEAARFKAKGVKAGVPDLFLPVPRGGYHGLYIELKRRGEHGTTRDSQKKWIAGLNKLGYVALVCRGWEEAANEIVEYLGGGE